MSPVTFDRRQGPDAEHAPVTSASPWTCPGCGHARTTAYCADCGERPRQPGDLTLRGLAVLLFQSFSNVDGRLLRSFRSLLTRPGALSVAYVEGRRIPFVGPLQLFFLVNVAFFAIQSFTRSNVFSSPLRSHLEGQDWSPFAQHLVARHLEERGIALADYAPVFDRAVVLHAKSLIILIVPPFALLLPLAFGRLRKPFVAHAVFALHLYAFLLCVFSASVAVAAVSVLLGGRGLDEPRLDVVLSLANLAACIVYLYVAIGAFYGTSGWQRGLQTLGLTVAVAVLFLGYRFALLLITLYTT